MVPNVIEVLISASFSPLAVATVLCATSSTNFVVARETPLPEMGSTTSSAAFSSTFLRSSTQ
eukprot:4631199-Heterocapsa_arctica.AAC.1